MTDPNMHDSQEQPEYGAYDRNRDEAQTPRYFDNPYGNPYMGGSHSSTSLNGLTGCRSRRRTPFAASTAYSASSPSSLAWPC